jgi:hypothetical protein
MIPYRPVGLAEMRLIFDAGLRAFPPRLPEQPIFYPVLTREYAAQIARDWNAAREPFAGYVTRFEIDDAYAARFEPHVVGAREHTELWVPAGELDEFNRHIATRVTLADAYFGPDFRGYVPEHSGLAGRNAAQQFSALAAALDYSAQDFHGDITSTSAAVFLHYPFWEQHDFGEAGLDTEACRRVLDAVQAVWSRAFPGVSLGCRYSDQPG